MRKVTLALNIGVIVLLLGILLIPVFDFIVKKKIEDKMTLSNGSYFYRKWKAPPYPLYKVFYLFNITNKEEYKLGKKLILSEVGPYTYLWENDKYNIKFNNNGTVSYLQKRLFTFIRNMSVGDEQQDMITTVNPLIATIASSLRNASYLERKIIEGLFGGMGNLFITRNVNELIWGYVDPVLHTACKIFPDKFTTDYIGYYMNKNNTDDGVYTIYTGADDIDKLGEIDMYKGSRYLHMWSTRWADLINGTDGSINQPDSDDKSVLYFFASDACRSLFGHYTSNVHIQHNIKLHRFTLGDDVFANVGTNPDNAGFCTKTLGCPGTGVSDLSVCTIVNNMYVPAVLSFPHFYLADQKYLYGIKGMRPNKDSHETTVDVEPMTGLLLQVSAKIQISITLPQHGSSLLPTNTDETTLVPVYWFDSKFTVNDKTADNLYHMLFLPLNIAEVLAIVLIVIGSCIVCVAATYLLYQKYIHQKLKNQDGEKCRLVGFSKLKL